MSVDLLLPYDKLVRRELRQWAEVLATELSEASLRDDLGSAAILLNNSALLFAHLGAFDVAATICRQQIRWARRQDDERERILLALQPWINEGRLAALSGDMITARNNLAVYDEITGARSSGFAPKLAIGPHELRTKLGDDYHDIASALRLSRDIDLWKALMANARPADALAHICSALNEPRTTNHHLVCEAGLIASLHLGRLAEAAYTAKELESIDVPYVQAVRRLHLLLGRRSNTSSWVREGKSLAALVLLGCFDDIDTQAVLRFCLRLEHALSGGNQCPEFRVAVLRRALNRAIMLGDEVFEWQILEKLLRCESQSTTELIQWREARESLSHRSWHWPIRRHTRSHAAWSIEPSFVELRQCVTRATNGPH